MSALPSLQVIYLKRCRSRAAKILKDSTHPGNHLFCLLPSGKRFRSMMAKTERLRRSFFPQAIRLLNTNSVHKHSQDPLLTVNIITFSSLLLYVQYPRTTRLHIPLIPLYYLLSPSTLFFSFLYILLFFAHLVVFLHIFFAHLIVFCTSYCFLHILLFCTFLFHCTFYSYFSFSYHMYALVLCYFI